MRNVTNVMDAMTVMNADGFGRRLASGRLQGAAKVAKLEEARRFFLAGIGMADGVVAAEAPVSAMLLGGAAPMEARVVAYSVGLSGQHGRLEDELEGLLASYADASRLLGDREGADRAVQVGRGVQSVNSVGFGKLLTNAGLLERGDGNFQGAVVAYDRAKEVFSALVDSEAPVVGTARFGRAQFRNLDVYADCLRDGVIAGALAEDPYLRQAFDKNTSRELLARANGNTSSYSRAARTRGQLFVWNAVQEDTAGHILSAGREYESAFERLGEGAEASWAGVVLRLHQAEALVTAVVHFCDKRYLGALKGRFDQVLDGSGYIPMHSLKGINGQRLREVAGVLADNGKPAYVDRVEALLE